MEQEKNNEITTLIQEKLDLQHQIDRYETIKDYQGHMNQHQKIKHVLKIKQENNELKKQLTKMCNDMRKLSEAQPWGPSNKELKTWQMKAQKYK